MMQADTMRGVFTILVTPFDERSQIDEASLRNLVEFNLDAGVHGLGVAVGSEIFKLSEVEREQATRIVVDQVRGRVPVVINTGAPGTDLAVLYSRAAERNGADALMITPPSFLPAGPDEVLDYYRAISDAVGIPIFIQDMPSAPVGPGLARRVAEECRWVRYIKVENPPVATRVADMVAAAGDQLIVFGGAGGGYFIEELRRGAIGTMPFCSQPEAFVQVWNLWHSGDDRAARELFDRTIMPINRIAGQGAGIFYYVHKELLRRRGVIRSATVRSPTPAIDAQTQRELEQLIEELYPTGDG
ncbi:MAG TPA: dihydrodipicolinate synthase family protein [Roseiflexaceae bacterium]|nr:dihydrodipicolinate synthase family protein [Roseiflexaceae bacterium]